MAHNVPRHAPMELAPMDLHANGAVTRKPVRMAVQAIAVCRPRHAQRTKNIAVARRPTLRIPHRSVGIIITAAVRPTVPQRVAPPDTPSAAARVQHVPTDRSVNVQPDIIGVQAATVASRIATRNTDKPVRELVPRVRLPAAAVRVLDALLPPVHGIARARRAALDQSLVQIRHRLRATMELIKAV